MMFYIKMAYKSLLVRRRQYRSLFAVCAVGVCIMLAVLMITDGMLASVNDKARLYYGGDVQLLGGEYLENTEAIADEAVSLLKEIVPKNVIISKRYDYDARLVSLYFEGSSVRQRVMKGVDFENEKTLFSRFTFVDGMAKKLETENSVIISEPIARKLSVKVGDSITLFIPTESGYNNTVLLVVTGIFQDSSVFGMYTSYLDYKALMKARNIPNTVNKISLYYANGEPTRFELERLQKELSAQFDMFPIAKDKTEFYTEFNQQSERKYCLVPLEANISDLHLLQQALNAIVVGIVALLVIIITVGISSTFRVIVMKRTVESGTFRALGMKPKTLLFVFITEVLLLLLSGSFTGLVLSLGIAKLVSIFNLSFISGFDMFLTNGFLNPMIRVNEIAEIIGIILVTTLVAVVFTIRRLIHISPAGAITSIQ